MVLSRWSGVATALVGAVLVIVTQQAGQLIRGRNPLVHLRTDFWYDQLGYLAIAANVRNGEYGLSEPVTMTGVSHYPRFYYSLIGWVADVAGLSTVTSWNLVSLLLQFAAAFCLGFVAVRLSGRIWVGLLTPIPFLTGTFAYLLSDSWYTTLDAHAVLWGPFGLLFSNNAETAGLSVGLIALSALAWVWGTPTARIPRAIVTIIASVLVGALSSFQTYSFLSATYLLTFGAALAGLSLARRRRTAIILSALLVVTVFVLGPLLSERIGQLPTLVFGLLPALPGLVVASVRSRGLVAVATLAAAAAASVQIVYTVGGMLAGDPFLSYRVASNQNLGVVSWQALVGSAAVMIPLIVATFFAIRLKDRVTLVLSATGLVTLPYLAVNDVWGANAEPYRFWLEGILLGGGLAFLGLSLIIGLLYPVSAHGKPPAQAIRPTKRLFLALLAVSAVVWSATVPDWALAMRDPALQGAWDPYTERENAIAQLAASATTEPTDGLLTTELCVDNRTAKVNSGSPIANYHLGMAWPDNRGLIDRIMAARDARELDFDAMRESDTAWVLTDSNCDSEWSSRYEAQLQFVESIDYELADGETISAGSSGPGTVTLWRVRDN